MAQPARSTHYQNVNDTGQNATNGRATITKIVITNTSGAVAWVQAFDLPAASVTIGTTLSTQSFPVADNGITDVDFFPGWVV